MYVAFLFMHIYGFLCSDMFDVYNFLLNNMQMFGLNCSAFSVCDLINANTSASLHEFPLYFLQGDFCIAVHF